MSSEEPYNYLAIENGVNIIDCTSQVPNCPAKNMLSTDRKVLKLYDDFFLFIRRSGFPVKDFLKALLLIYPIK